MSRRSLPAGAFAAGIAAAVLWGGNTVSIKLGLAGITPLMLAAIRFFVGGVVIGVWALAERVRIGLEPGELRRLLPLGALFVVQIAFLNLATSLTLASRTTLLLSTFPFFAGLFAHLFLHGERMHLGRVLGMVLSFAGLAVLFADGLLSRDGSILGDTLALASGALLGLRLVHTRSLTQGISPAKLLLWQDFMGVPAFLALSIVFERSVPSVEGPVVVGAILYQGMVVAGLCFIIQTLLLRRYEAAPVSAFGFVTPVSAVLMSALILKEPVTIPVVASLVLVAAGIFVANRAVTRRPAGPRGRSA